MTKAIRNKVFILSFTTIFIVVLLAFLLNFVNVKASSDYKDSSKWDGAGVATPLESVNYTSKYVNFSEVHTNGHTPKLTEIYVIETANDLYQLSMLSKGTNNSLYLSLHYVLGNDINYNDAANESDFFAPIGYDVPFTGTFDGQGFEITNLFFAQILSESVYIQVYQEQLVYYSMFSKIGVGGTVKNLGIKNVWMYQPIEWGIMAYASYLVGLNEGTVEHVYVKDDRQDSGLNIDGAFQVSGLMSVNKGTFREAYVSLGSSITGAVELNTSNTAVLTKNEGGIVDNIYYDSTLYYGQDLVSDPSLPLATADFQNESNFDNMWYFNNSYYNGTFQSRRNLVYPTLKGIKIDSSNNYLITSANELLFMLDLFNVSSYFRNQNFIIQNDIDFNAISKKAYKAPAANFAGTFQSAVINSGGETLYTRNNSQGAENYYSIIGMYLINNTLVNNNASYGMFGALSGTVKNINFVNSILKIENISDHVQNAKTTIGFLSGIIEGGKIENVHINSNITVSSNAVTNKDMGYVNIGGFVGEGKGTISNSTFNGAINGGSHTLNSRANLSSIGGFVGKSDDMKISSSVNKANITGFSYNQNSYTLYNYFGGIIGSGTIDSLNKVINKGNLVSSNKINNSFNVYLGGIIGKQSGLVNKIKNVNNEGTVDLYVPSRTNARIAGYGVIEGGDNYELFSISNSGEIKITHPILTDPAMKTIVDNSIVEGAGVITTVGVNGIYNGLYNDADVTINMSLVKQYAGIILNNNSYVSPGNYNNTSTGTVALNKHSSIFQAYNLGNINVTSTNTIYHNWFKFSGVSVGKNIDFEEVRNNGYIDIKATHAAPNNLLYGTSLVVDGLSNPQKTMKINGVFEEVSQNRTAKNIYNGGRLSFTNSNTNFIFNLFISGIGYKNANTNLYAQKGIDEKSVDFSPIEGSIHNAVNDGEIYGDSRIKGQSRMAGIVLINEGMLTSVANTGDIYNSNAIQSNANTGAWFEFEVETGGITFLMASRYAQIRDSVNYGNIVSYGTPSSTGPGWVNASGIATRNDKTEDNTDAGSANNYQYFAKIAFSINYGDVFSYNIRNSDSLGLNSETYNKASGILSLGLCSSINNLNYGNIYGKNLASGIYGFVFIDKFVKHNTVNVNEIFVANSINYGKIRRITDIRAFQYNGANLGITTNTAYTQVQTTRPAQYAFGAVIGKVHTGSTNNWDYASDTNAYSIRKVAFSYLINFDNLVDLVGNNPAITNESTTVSNQITMYMATTKANDTSLKPFDSIKSYTLNANNPPANPTLTNNGGIFNISFPLRTVPAVNNFITDEFIKDFIQFIPKSKVNDPLLQKIDFGGISASAGIYALSSTKGITNGLFMPDNIDLNKLNPVTYSNDVAYSDATWQDDVNSGSVTLRAKFFTKMKQLEKAIATTIFDLEMYMVSDPTIKLKNPQIDDVNGIITYYVPTNSDPALGITEGSYTVYDYVQVTPQNGASLGATWIPSKANPAATGTWVGDYKLSGSSYVAAEKFATSGRYNIEMTTDINEAMINNKYYDSRYINSSFPDASVYVVVTTNIQPKYYVKNFTTKTAGNGGYSLSGRNNNRIFTYEGPTTQTTYMKVPREVPIFNNSLGFRINYDDDSTYELAYMASFKHNEAVHSLNKDATILQTYGPYDSNGNLYSDGTLIDSYDEHYGIFRVYSESYGKYNPVGSDPDYNITFRDYKILIKRVQPQSITAISGVTVDGATSTSNSTNIKNVTINTQALYKPGTSPSLAFTYQTNNVPNGTDLRPNIRLYTSSDVLVDESLYTIEGGTVTTNGAFDELTGSYGIGTTSISLRFSDQLTSGTYKLKTDLASNDSYNINIVKRVSTEAEFTEFTFNGVTSDSFGKTELISYIPYGIFYDVNDINTKIVDFSNVTSTQLPNYLDNLKLSLNATLVSVTFNVILSNAGTSQHEYRIVYRIRAENGTFKNFTHRVLELAPSAQIIKSYKDGNELSAPLNQSSLLREEISFFRMEYNLANIYLANNNFKVQGSYSGPDAANAVLDQAYFLNYVDVGFEVDFDYSAAVGNYTFAPSFIQSLNINGIVVNWNYNFQTMLIVKKASDVSNLTNITFISDTVYAGLNIIIDNVVINESSYSGYLDTPSTRKITALPSSGISYNQYGGLNKYYIVGQVQMSDLDYYAPSFYLPTGAIIRRVIDVANANNPSLQSEDLFDDFTPETSGDFNYIHYRVYAEDYIINDPIYGQHYTDYFVSVQDITNNIYFTLQIIVDDSVGVYDFEKLFVTFNLSKENVIQSSMSLFTYFNGVNGPRIGDNEQFRSSQSGIFEITIDLAEIYDFEIEFGSASVEVDGKKLIIPGELLPKRYDLTLRIVNKSPDLEWGKHEITDYTPNI